MKNLLISLFVLGFVFSQSVQAEIGFSLGSFWGRGHSCQEAVDNARMVCFRALENFAATVKVTGNMGCPFWTARCTNYGMPQATLLGYAQYDNDTFYQGIEQGHFFLERASGYSCEDASYRAALNLYNSLRYFSGQYVVKDFDLQGCSCTGHGFASASCGASVRYINSTGTRWSY